MQRCNHRLNVCALAVSSRNPITLSSPQETTWFTQEAVCNEILGWLLDSRICTPPRLSKTDDRHRGLCGERGTVMQARPAIRELGTVDPVYHAPVRGRSPIESEDPDRIS